MKPYFFKKTVTLFYQYISIHCFQILCFCGLLFAILCAYHNSDQLFLATLKTASPPVTIVIDPGHGGNDPGKIGVHQELEKEINLSIALKCKQKLEKQGIHVILTRNKDICLAPPSSSNKKSSDMKQRRSIIETSNAALAISIHQNSYPDSSIFGAQVFYYESSFEGKRLAQLLQQALFTCNPQNRRTEKSNTSYYILKSGSCPVVICECGFLSNPQECSNLTSTPYQECIATSITIGILSYLKENSKGAQTPLPVK